MKFQKFTPLLGCATILLAAGLLSPLRAATVTINASEDTTLWQTDPNNNLGSHTDFVAGTTRNLQRSRGLFRFNVASAVPAGATINTVTLTLTVVKQSSFGAVASTFELHRVLQDWGEGNNVNRRGTVADAGEATWNNRFAPASPWSIAGAASPLDFAATVSGTRAIAGPGAYAFASAPNLVADVQNWLNNPSANFGWLVMSQSEGTGRTARRFASSEAASGRPALFIDFTPIPEPGTLSLFGLGGLGGLWLRRSPRRVRTL